MFLNTLIVTTPLYLPPFLLFSPPQTAAELVVIEKAKKAEQAEKAIAAKELKKDIAEALEKKRVEMEVAAKAYV